MTVLDPSSLMTAVGARLRLPLFVMVVGLSTTVLLTLVVNGALRRLGAGEIEHAIDAADATAQELLADAAGAAEALAVLARTEGRFPPEGLTRFARAMLEGKAHLDGLVLVDAQQNVVAAVMANGEWPGRMPDTAGPRITADVDGPGGPAVIALVNNGALAGILHEPVRISVMAPDGSRHGAVGTGTMLGRRPVRSLGPGWMVEFLAPAEPPGGPIRWEPVATLLFGLGLTVLLYAYALFIARHSGDTAALAATLERANAELRRRMAERDRFAAVLEDSERRYRDIYENAVEGIFTTSAEGRFLSANPALVRMLGYANEADLLETLRDTSRQLYADPTRRDEFRRTVSEQGSVIGFEAEIRRKDGSTLWVTLSARAIRNAAGRVVAFQGTTKDISERRRAETALRLAKEQADLANRAKSEFLANMSHELRTPLNAIIGFSQMIGEQSLGPIGNEKYAEYARDIQEGGTLLLALINDILDLSRIEAGRKELNERTVDIARAVRASLKLVNERATQGGVRLLTAMAEPLPLVRADEIALKQILSNLLSNAVKFTPRGGTVTAGVRPDAEGGLLLTVADTGVGIRADDMDRVMQPFGQVDSPLTRSTGGAGLGLPLARALVELHGGTLTLESEPGRGTIATVRLPPDRVQQEPVVAAARRM